MSDILEPASLKVFEHSSYVGGHVAAILYGVTFTVYFQIMQGLWSTKYRSTKRKKIFHAVFSTVMVFLVTINVLVDAILGDETWIVRRDAPGGVTSFIIAESSLWYAILQTTCVYIMVIFSNTFLLYRLYVIFEANYLVIIIPSLEMMTSFALVVVQLNIAVKPNFNMYHGKAVNLGTPYYALTLSSNIIITLLIVMRVYKLGKSVTNAMGHSNARIYTNVSAMLIESAAPYAMFGIAWTVAYAIGSPTAVAFGYANGVMTCLSPLLIILRVVNRTGWDSDIVSQSRAQGIRFHPTGGTMTTVLSAPDIVSRNPAIISVTPVTDEDKGDLDRHVGNSPSFA